MVDFFSPNSISFSSLAPPWFFPGFLCFVDFLFILASRLLLFPSQSLRLPPGEVSSKNSFQYYYGKENSERSLLLMHQLQVLLLVRFLPLTFFGSTNWSKSAKGSFFTKREIISKAFSGRLKGALWPEPK
jgi:hypothetical protein